MLMTCLMKQQLIHYKKTIYKQDNAYFNTESFIILESTDVKEILSLMIRQILHKISTYKKMVQVGILRKC